MLALPLKATFKSRFSVDKSDINTGKVRCVEAKHFLNNCTGIINLGMWKLSLLKKLKKEIMT